MMRYVGYKCGCAEKKSSMDIIQSTYWEQSISDYWTSLRGLDQKRWFTKEIYLRNALKIRTITDAALDKLRKSKRKKDSLIENDVSYDILNLNSYADRFFYSTIDRRTEHLSSDIVCHILFIGEESHFVKD